ncbi:MAG TPA: CcmD family protein [Candidatus Acidoferrales bacterium]
MRNLFWAYAAVWLIHLGYLFRLASGQKKLSDDLAALKKSVVERER